MKWLSLSDHKFSLRHSVINELQEIRKNNVGMSNNTSRIVFLPSSLKSVKCFKSLSEKLLGQNGDIEA
jgi:hypothetical protein